ncbi:GH18 domain-containing protein [Heracleum sosnowskyi]|uniref:Chitinase domain-containing protein 1 n=1 Tax=Heracleum sosnowskyi TaxID=360622 RepID=A0AAD8HWX4_9APIA|nr:GH18 domain-containing protein [Heracleum sosnowskyi]
MAKKRDTELTTKRRKKWSESPSESSNSSSNSDQTLKPLNLILIFIVIPVISVILYRTVYGPTAVSVGRSVYDRDLVKTEVKYDEIIAEHSRVSSNLSRIFKQPVLAYVTPWNSKGYELAKKFSSKLTHISPVWYDLKSHGANLVLEGRHNADKGWISELRKKGDAQILPRVVLEAVPTDLLKNKKQRDKAINLIITECSEMEYDGIVLESWSRWAAYGVLHDPDTRKMALKFIQELGQAMHSVGLEMESKKNLQLVYVIGPPRSENPGPNAPLKWIHSVMQLLLRSTDSSLQTLAQKIFIGINFYGNNFALSGGLGGGPITGREYLSLLEHYRPSLQWEINSAEHYFVYTGDQNDQHVVFYPSLLSIAKRLEEAHAWRAGISIWEIGQGLDYFFDIL